MVKTPVRQPARQPQMTARERIRAKQEDHPGDETGQEAEKQVDTDAESEEVERPARGEVREGDEQFPYAVMTDQAIIGTDKFDLADAEEDRVVMLTEEEAYQHMEAGVALKRIHDEEQAEENDPEPEPEPEPEPVNRRPAPALKTSRRR